MFQPPSNRGRRTSLEPLWEGVKLFFLFFPRTEKPHSFYSQKWWSMESGRTDGCTRLRMGFCLYFIGKLFSSVRLRLIFSKRLFVCSTMRSFVWSSAEWRRPKVVKMSMRFIRGQNARKNKIHVRKVQIVLMRESEFPPLEMSLF